MCHLDQISRIYIRIWVQVQLGVPGLVVDFRVRVQRSAPNQLKPRPWLELLLTLQIFDKSRPLERWHELRTLANCANDFHPRFEPLSIFHFRFLGLHGEVPISRF
jgi:hypothetical protein